MSASYANLHSSIASINVSLSLFDVTDNDNADTSFGIGSRTFRFRAMDYIIASYHLNLPTLVVRSKFNASGNTNTSHRHTSICGVEFSRVDVLQTLALLVWDSSLDRYCSCNMLWGATHLTLLTRAASSSLSCPRFAFESTTNNIIYPRVCIHPSTSCTYICHEINTSLLLPMLP
eukprot:scaffold7807_cov95-Skeletonema_dohrnii-CCMP3373.AAC.4